eukprot:GHVL01038811.1.p3 GENE.GHVL01038811.1~~GHVL01038811.1.p3  ORF type:complete len:284 (+),score=34.84 GHVL01038811.1:1516-2367(+)
MLNVSNSHNKPICDPSYPVHLGLNWSESRDVKNGVFNVSSSGGDWKVYRCRVRLWNGEELTGPGWFSTRRLAQQLAACAALQNMAPGKYPLVVPMRSTGLPFTPQDWFNNEPPHNEPPWYYSCFLSENDSLYQPPPLMKMARRMAQSNEIRNKNRYPHHETFVPSPLYRESQIHNSYMIAPAGDHVSKVCEPVRNLQKDCCSSANIDKSTSRTGFAENLQKLQDDECETPEMLRNALDQWNYIHSSSHVKLGTESYTGVSPLHSSALIVPPPPGYPPPAIQHY